MCLVRNIGSLFFLSKNSELGKSEFVFYANTLKPENLILRSKFLKLNYR